MPFPSILLLGGGYTLQRVGKLLEPERFIITSRSPARCAQWREHGWNSQEVSIQDTQGMQELFQINPGIEVVIDSVPPIKSDSERGDSASTGVHNVTEAIRRYSSVKRIIYLSTTGVFGVRDGSRVDESTPAKPWNSQGAARLECENEYRRLVSKPLSSGLTPTFTALRLPAIYGPDRGILQSLTERTYSLVGDGSQWTNRIHVDDLARIIVGCADLSTKLPPILCVNDDFPTQALDVVSYLCQRYHLDWPPSVSPQEVLSRGGYSMLANQRVRNTLMKDKLRLSLIYPSFREGAKKQP